MKSVLIGLLALSIAAQAQTPHDADEVRVSIQQFRSVGGAAELEPLRTILPNLLEGAFFQYKWLAADVTAAAMQAQRSAGTTQAKADRQYRIDGQFVQLGDKIRVDVLVRNANDGSVASGEYETFDEAEMNSAMQRLATRCARAMASAGVQEQKSKAADAIVAATLTATSNSAQTAYLQEAIPRAIVDAARDANLVFRSGAIPSERQERFAVSGAVSSDNQRLEVLIRILEANGNPLELRATSEDKSAFSLSGTVAAQVLEAIRGMIEESNSTDALFHPDGKDAGAFIQAGDAARERQRPELAAVMYRRAEMVDANNPVAAQRLIRVYIESGSTAGALSEAEVFGGSDTKAARYHYARGLAASLQADYKGALEEYRVALDSKPEANLTPYVYRAMGDAQAAGGTKDGARQAIASYQQAVAAAPANMEIVRALSYAYSLAGNTQEAIATLERAHEQAPEKRGVREDLASLYRDQAATFNGSGRFEESLSWANKCLALSPENKTVVSHAATYAAYALGFGLTPPRFDEALKLLLRATEADPNNEWAYRQLAYVYIDEKKWDGALNAAQRALSLRITADGYWTLADVYSGMRDTDKAAETLQKALSLEGSNKSETYVKLAQVYSGRGDNELALRTLEDAKKADPNSEAPWLNEGYILQSLARYNDALTAYQEALKRKATRDAFFGEGTALMSEQHYREAGDVFGRARLLDTKCIACSARQAQAWAAQGKVADATRILEKELGADWPRDLEYPPVIEVYAKAGKLAVAEAKLNATAARYPDDLLVRGSLGYLWHEYSFEFDKDYELQRRLLQTDPKDPDAQGATAEAALTTGHYEEAVNLAATLLADKTISAQLRFPIHLVRIAALLGENNATQALLAIGAFVSEYRATPGDWDRSWRFNGFHEYISKSADFSATTRELLETMIAAMTENRPKSDQQVAKVEMLVASDSFRRLLGAGIQRAAVP